jgi:phosphatidylinositol kinase/protein kinase (PI-3  family)
MILVRHCRVRNISPKFKSVKFLHKDKINDKMFETVSEYSSVAFFISTLRCVICLLRRLRRLKSPVILKKTKIIIILHLSTQMDYVLIQTNKTKCHTC